MHKLFLRTLIISSACLSFAACHSGHVATSGASKEDSKLTKPLAAEIRLETGCGSETIKSGLSLQTLTHQGRERSYHLYVPSGYKNHTKAPLVLNFHGTGGNALMQLEMSNMNSFTEKRNVLMAYPEGLKLNGKQVFNAGLRDFSSAPRDDVDFSRAIVKHVSQNACLDLSRVYSAGFSNGARMSQRLACEASDMIAAIFAVAGLSSIEPDNCTIKNGVATLQFHGTKDPLAPWDAPGQFTRLSVPEAKAEWAKENSCNVEPKQTYLNKDVSCSTFSNCTNNTEFTFCAIADGGHCWTNQERCYGGTSSTTVDASEMGLEFMLKFRRQNLQ